MTYTISEGNPTSYGANVGPDGINFAIFVEGFPQVHLLLIDPHNNSVIETIEIPFQTGYIKHVHIHGLRPPVGYRYLIQREAGPPELLLDPYAKNLLTSHTWYSAEPYHPIGLISSSSTFDWEQVPRPAYQKEELIIYEMHVRSFTRDDSCHTGAKGTFRGLQDKIPHLKELGVNAVELMPIHEFNEKEYELFHPNPLSPTLCQYWGYSTVNFFAPMNRYVASSTLTGAHEEFKEMVRELHRAQIEVILDIVLNHTAEGNEKGPTFSFKGLGPTVYYMRNAQHKFLNYSGCGNTLNCNHPLLIRFVLDVLHYWALEMHVDGFRFDLASTFYRDEEGHVLRTPPLLEAITKDPLLAQTKLIAEPWDAAGLYQVGGFFPESTRWSEWNGRYRDCVRRFLKGDSGLKGEFATRICGSEDLYGHDKRLPRNSLNFITSHDGFTLRDLVSYNYKHNLSNGEDNRDGMDSNDSWNCGTEGATEDPAIIFLRERQMRNFHLALMVSQGIPMVLMGDEYGHTKRGNNNTWCQDNPLNWFLWDELEKNGPFFHFFKGLIHFRRSHHLLQHRKFLTDENIEWHGINPLQPLWETDDHFIAFTLFDTKTEQELYIAFNASHNSVEVNLPPQKFGKLWKPIINTSLLPPNDCQFGMNVAPFEGSKVSMMSYSSLLFC